MIELLKYLLTRYRKRKRTMIDINKATEKELQRIPFIGKARAAEIITKRPFKDIYELSNVKGLGAARMGYILKLGYVKCSN